LVGGIVPHSDFVLPSGNQKRHSEAAIETAIETATGRGNEKRQKDGSGEGGAGSREQVSLARSNAFLAVARRLTSGLGPKLGNSRQLTWPLRNGAPKSSPFSDHLFTESLQTGFFRNWQAAGSR
jgi:hypothetical protein